MIFQRFISNKNYNNYQIVTISKYVFRLRVANNTDKKAQSFKVSNSSLQN